MRSLLQAAVLFVLFSLIANAQTFRGAINGTVTDPSGAVVANANVNATDNATGIAHTSITTTGGQFAFQDIPLGSYRVSVSAAGFNPVTIAKVPVTAGAVYTLPIVLKVGSDTTTVEVSAASVVVDTTTQTQTMTIPSTVVQDMPLNGRDFVQLTRLIPGVTRGAPGSNKRGANNEGWRTSLLSFVAWSNRHGIF